MEQTNHRSTSFRNHHLFVRNFRLSRYAREQKPLNPLHTKPAVLMGKLCEPQLPIGAEEAGIGADDLEELSSDGEEYFRLGEEDESFKDYSALKLKPDHENRFAPVSLTC